MLRLSLRALTALAALFLIFVGAQFWLGPVAAAAKMGLAAQNSLGLATLRADNATVFLGTGVLALLAAIRGEGRILTAPIILLAIALIGRFLTLATVMPSHALYPPMVIEAVLIALFATSRWALGTR